MFEKLMENWTNEMNADWFYLMSSRIMVFSGLFYMFAAHMGMIPAKYKKNDYYDYSTAFFIHEAWVFKNVVFLVAYPLAVVFGKSYIGRFASLLLFADSILAYSWYPRQIISSHQCVTFPKFTLLIFKNMFFAFVLGTWNSEFVRDQDLTNWNILDMTIGFFFYWYGMRLKMINYEFTRYFPYTNDARIMGAPSFENNSSPDRLGEALQWLGFHMICGNPVSMAYALYKIQVATGKAVIRHRWYIRNNRSYPHNRFIMIPHIF